MTESTKALTAGQQDYVIGKLGGSVITDKTRLKVANEAVVEAFAQAFGALAPAMRSRVILMAGGGSFGHASAHPEFMPQAPDRLAASAPVFHEWAALFEEIWRRSGPPCKVLNADALLKDSGFGIRFDPAPFLSILDRGVLPVLMPGIVFQPRRANLVSSDLLPLFIARVIDVTRYAALSDVPGVTIGGKIVSAIPAQDRRAVLSAVQHSAKPDVTGGMRRKLQVMLRLAAQGIEGVICSGQPELLERALFASPPPGTWIPARGEEARRPVVAA